jgi:hypothetical protein
MPTRARGSLQSISPAVLALLVACASESQPAAKQADSDSTRLAPSATTSAAPTTAVAAEAREVCDSIRGRWKTAPHTQVEMRDTVANPINRNSVDQGTADESLPPTPACAVEALADSGVDADAAPYVSTPGWAEIWIISADGPDSQMLTYQRGMVRCQVESEWGSPDDADSTAAAQKSFRERSTCWKHNRPVVPADTGHPALPSISISAAFWRRIGPHEAADQIEPSREEFEAAGLRGFTSSRTGGERQSRRK